MSRTVTIDLDVNDAQAVRAWQRGKQAIAEFDKTGAKAGKTFGGMFAASTKSVLASAAGFAGVGSVIGGIVTAAALLRQEYDNILQRQQKAANIQIPLADLERQMALNVGGDQNAQLAVKMKLQKDVLAERDRIARAARTTPAIATEAFGTALSARGGATIQQTGAAVEAAILVAPKPEDAEFLAAGALDLARGGADPTTGANWLAAAGSALRVTKTAKVAKALAMSVNAGNAYGNSERDILAEFAIFGGQASESEGEPTSTALNAWHRQLRKAEPNAKNSFAALEAIAADPKRAAKFLKNMTGEGRFLTTQEKLIKDPAFRQEMYGIRDRAPSFRESDKLARDQKALLDALPTASIRNIAKGADAATELMLAGDVTSISSILRDKIPALKQSYGATSFATKLEAMATTYDSNIGRNPVAALDSITRQLSADEKKFRAGTLAREATAVAAGWGATVIPGTAAKPATVREVQLADAVFELIKVLKEERPRISAAVDAMNAPAPAVELIVTGRPANASIKTVHAPRPHSRLNSNSNVPPQLRVGGRR